MCAMLDGRAYDDRGGWVKVERLPIPGALVLRSDLQLDSRGSFQRIVDLAEMEALGLETQVAQISAACNAERGTVRGLHYQVPPDEEAKTLWCTSGSVYDVIVDLRRDSPTYGKWAGIELSQRDPAVLHVPRGLAHGYQTLEDHAELIYVISAPFVADSARSLLWRDPTLRINWPLPVTRISDRDREAPAWLPEY